MPKKLSKKDLVVVSKEKAYWLRCKENGENEVHNTEEILKFKIAVLEMVNNKIKTCKD